MRKRKPETIVRELRRDLKRALKETGEFSKESAHFRGRATRAEMECSEWKRRFDALLERTPKVAD